MINFQSLYLLRGEVRLSREQVELSTCKLNFAPVSSQDNI